MLQHSGGCGKRAGLAASELVINNDECWPYLSAGNGMQQALQAATAAPLLVSYNASSRRKFTLL